MIKYSDSLKELAGALLEFQKEVGKIPKDASNPFFGSKYADLPAILDTIKQPLINAKLVVTQLPSGLNELTTILIHSTSGEFIESSYSLKPVKEDPQASGSLYTYARRYAILAILNLNADVDDDANAVSKPAKKAITKTKEPVAPVAYPEANETNAADIF